MTRFFDTLFQLRSVSSAGEGVELRWAHPIPLWAWVFITLACILLAGWSYWRLLGRAAPRSILAVLRTLTLLLLAVLAAGPELIKQNDQIERDWVVVMADRSASLTVADTLGEGNRRIPREQQLRAAIDANWSTFADLAQKRNVLFLGFDAAPFDLRPTTDAAGAITGVNLGEPSGRRTALGQSIEQALRRVAARPVAGIVLLSDGRSSDNVSRGALRQLDARQVPVFSVPLGSPEPLADLALSNLDAPTAAFVGDLIPINVSIDRLGGNPDAQVRGKVQLIDDATGLVLDERPLDDPAPTATPEAASARRITLTTKPTQPGAINWTVRLVLDNPDLSQENNRLRVRIELVDRPIRVVYFDGYPRWEYRYLKNLLVREKSIRSSTLLLAGERRYIQEGTDALDALPRSDAEWNAFDVIVMGDLRPGLFSEEQLRQIRKLIAERGAGLLWIGGPAATPAAWRGTPLADLVPFAAAPAETSTGPQVWLSPVLLSPGPGASRYGVLQLGENPAEPWPAFLSQSDLGWNTFRWAQRIEPGALKPTTEVLALASPADAPSSSAATPLVMTMRYGAGRVVYVATDETWRFRYGRGEVLTERLWIPLIRLLARESLGRSGKPAVLAAAPGQSQVNQPVQVSVRLLDQTLMDKRPESITVRVLPSGGDSGRAPSAIALTLKPESAGDDGASPSLFTTTWVAGEPGLYRIEPADQLLSGLDLFANLEVVLPDDELRIPQTDHAVLASLSKATGGRVLTPDQLSGLPALLPNRELHLMGAPDIETLWDKPIVWTVLILMLILEWVGRRLIKLS